MNQQRRNAALVAIACLLLLVAAYRFGSMAMDARSRAELNSDHSQFHPKIVSHVGPQRPDPFKDLDLTDEQRRKIDDILKANLPKLPPPDQGGPSKPHFFKLTIPMDKIRAVLTPAQREKFDRMHAGNQKAVMGMPGGAPGSFGSQPGLSGPQPDSSAPQMFIIRKGQPDH
jgi:Spy/CpxP family protein refolding chaperone